MPTQHPAALPSRVRLVAVLAVLLLQVVLLWIYYSPRSKGLVGDESSYLETAGAIDAGAGDHDEPMRATLYAWLLAAVDADDTNRLPIQVLQLVTLLAAALLLRSLTGRLFDSPLAGDLAALGLLLYPTLGAFAHYIWPEILHLGLWIAVLWILATRPQRAPWLLLAGSLLGLAILMRHLLLPFVPLIAVALWLDSSADRGRRLIWLLTPVLLLLAPALWLDWNHDGRLRSASNARFNLWVGLNDQSRKSLEEPIVFAEYQAYMGSGATAAERDAILEQKIRDLLARDGWRAIVARQLGRQYFRLFDKDTFFTDQLPGGALHGSERGYTMRAGPTAMLLRWLNYSLYAAILALAVHGITSCRPRESRWLQLILLFLAYNLALFLLLHVKSRYRLQLMPFLVLFAAHGVDTLLSGAGDLAAPRRWAAVGGATALLFLAFGGALL